MRKVKAIDCIPALNTVKKGYQMADKTFSKLQFIDAWKNCGLPYYNKTWKYIVESNILTEVEKGVYKFADKEPIHYSRVQTILDKAYLDKKKYMTPKTKKAEELVKTALETATNILEDEIAKAVELLKNNGYKVFKPQTITVYEEV